MQYTILGNTGLIVSRLSFGGMTFTAGDRSLSAIFKTETAEASNLIGLALDAGINFFDTADVYASGQSELMLGGALKGHRNGVIISTKVGGRTGPAITQAYLSRRHILWSVDESLKRLGTEWIDVYMAHKEDPYTPLEETLSALDALVRAGKVRYLAFSNWSAWRAAAAMEIQRAAGFAQFTHGQMYYSLLGRDVERDIIPMMQRYKLGLTVWSPLAGGFLSGKYKPENLSDPSFRYSGIDMFPFDKTQGFKIVERARSIAANHGLTVANVAIAWLLKNSAVTSVVLGASSTSQLEDNLRSIDLTLSSDECADLDTATAPIETYPNWFNERLGVDPLCRKALGF